MNYLAPITNVPKSVYKLLSLTGITGTTMPAAKKRKLDAAISTRPPPPCSITRLPTELVTDILSYMTTPREILNLARTCKFFCTMLTNPDAAFVWRHARKRAIPSPIPNPTPNFNESSYAAFIFDGGRCCMCQKDTKHMLHSYSLRVRLCGSTECRVKWKKTCVVPKPNRLDHRPPSLQWTLCAESAAVVQWSSVGATTKYYPSIDIYYLKTDYEAIEAEWMEGWEAAGHDAVSQLAHKQRCERVLAPRVKLIMEHATLLYRWREEYLKDYWKVKNQNEKVSKELAAKEGWEAWDVLASSTFSSFYRARNNEHVLLGDDDVARLKPIIKIEVETIVEKRRLREKEAKMRSKQEGIKAHWHYLRTRQQHEAMPTLQVFRELPVPKLLLRSGDVTFEAAVDDAEIFDKLRDPKSIISRLLDDNLDHWRNETRQALGLRLGGKKYNARNPLVVHPAERLNARYRCNKCNRVGDGYQEDGSMTFQQACSHTCFHLNNTKREKQKWDAAQFDPAEKIIAAIGMAMTLASTDPSLKATAKTIRNIGPRFLCTSCPSQIVMDFNQIAGHAERHENMQMTLLSQAEADAILTQPLELGLCRTLMRKPPSEEKEDIQSQPVPLGCRHCMQAVESSASRALGPHAESHLLKREKLRNLNAIRSHLKAVHGVHTIRDEDIFRIVL